MAFAFNPLVIVFIVIGLIGLFFFVLGIILAETKFKGNIGWEVYLFVFGGLILFIISAIIVGIAGVKAGKNKEQMRRRMPSQDKRIPLEERMYSERKRSSSMYLDEEPTIYEENLY